VDVATLVRQAREVLQDVDPPYRYGDTALIDAANLAVQEAWRHRPDLFYGRVSLETGQPAALTALDTTQVPLPNFMDVALLSFVAGYAELRDDQFTVDGRAMALLKNWNAALVGDTS
jgi:hypothetical protein